jgi:hypothetical protein
MHPRSQFCLPPASCKPSCAQFGQATQALWAGHALRWWLRPPGPCTGFNRAKRDATKWCDGVIDGIAYGQQPATASPQSDELPSGAFDDFTHRPQDITVAGVGLKGRSSPAAVAATGINSGALDRPGRFSVNPSVSALPLPFEAHNNNFI